MTDPLQHLVSSRSWEWLYELCRPLALDVQLLDRTFAPVPVAQARPGPHAGPLAPRVIGRLRPAVEAAMESQTPQLARLGPLTITISPVRASGTLVGVLLLAPTEPHPAKADAQPLATLSLWLRSAVERHLASHAVGAEHLSALTQVLRAAPADGSDRAVVATFAEALAVWHDIEVGGYIETAPGVFMRVVSLASRHGDDRPLVFPPQAVPPPLELTRMPQTHVDGGERAGGADALVVTLSRQGELVWLLTLAGGIDACEPTLLSGYVSALDLTLALATRASSARLALAVSTDLARESHDPPQALRRALDRVRRSLGAALVAFSAKDVNGTMALAVRAKDSPTSDAAIQAQGPRPKAQGSSGIHIVRKAPLQRRMTLSIEDESHPGWSPAEHAQAHAVADVLENWISQWDQGSMPKTQGPTWPSPIEQDIEDQVQRTLGRNEAVTIAVFSFEPPPPAALTDVLVTESRRHLRDGDVVNFVSPGDVVVLLAQATGAHALAAVRRLRTALTHAAQRAGIAIVAEGFATRMPGQDVAGNLLDEARGRHRDPGAVAR